LLKGEKRTATPGGSVAISRMKSGMHFAGLGELITYEQG
jgi:hypothetical protein